MIGTYKGERNKYTGRRVFMSEPMWYQPSSPYKKSDDGKLNFIINFYNGINYTPETVNDFEKIHKQLLSSTSTDQKQFIGTIMCIVSILCDLKFYTELHAQLREVKADIADIANSAKEQVTTDYLSTEMNKQTANIETVQSDMTSQSEVVKELQSEVRTLVTAFREQTEMVVEQQRQIKESL